MCDESTESPEQQDVTPECDACATPDECEAQNRCIEYESPLLPRGPSTALLLEPHQDDAILFASFLCLTHRPDVVTVLADARNQPGVTGAMRDEENARAFRELGLDPPVPWPYRDDEPDWDAIKHDLQLLAKRGYGSVFAPWPERGGHDQHNRIAQMAQPIFGYDRLTFYTTYRYGGPKTVVPDEVHPRREWVPLKHRALACFESQIHHGPVRFFLMDLREYVVNP